MKNLFLFLECVLVSQLKKIKFIYILLTNFFLHVIFIVIKIKFPQKQYIYIYIYNILFIIYKYYIFKFAIR